METGTTIARQALIEEHLDVARQVAMKLWRKVRARGFTLDEVVAESYLGLVRAVDKYDPSRSTSPGTWVKFKVEMELLQWLREQSPLTKAHGIMVSRGKARPVATVPIHRWDDAENGDSSGHVDPKEAHPGTDHREPPPDERAVYQAGLRAAIEGLTTAWRALATAAARMEEEGARDGG